MRRLQPIAWVALSCLGAVGVAPGGANYIAAQRDPQESSAFSFDADGRDRTLIRHGPGPVVPIKPGDVEQLYGRPDGFTILAEVGIGGEARRVDVCSAEYAERMRLRGPLRPTFWDLSDLAGWPSVHVPPGVLAVDPRYGRFKFYEGYKGRVSLVRQVPTPHGNPAGLAAKGNRLFLGTGESAHGLLVLDATDPANLEVVADLPRRGPWILDVAAYGDLAFAADAAYLNIYDLSDPLHPKVLVHHPCGAKYMLADPELQVVYYRTADNDTLYRLDVSDPQKPVPLPPWPRKYKSESTCWPCRLGNYLYMWVRVPLHPEEKEKQIEPPEPAAKPDLDLGEHENGEMPSEEEPERKRAVRASRYDAGEPKVESYELTRIYDIGRDRANPALLSETKPGQVIHTILKQDGRSYGLGRAPEPGLAVYDLSDPASPRLLCVHPYTAGAWTLADGYLYSAAGHPDGKDGGLAIHEFKDVRKPPKLVGRLNQFDRRYMEERSAWSAPLCRGDYVYVQDYFYGVVAIDVSNKAEPRIAGGLHMAGEAFCIAVSDSRVFVGENMGGLTIIDNTVPERAAVVGNFGVGGGWGVAARGNIAFCANLAGLMIVDTEDPKQPEELSFSDGIVNALAVKLDGRYAYCMGNAGYGDIFDISDLRKPLRLGRFTTSRAFKLDVRDPYLYVADEREGLVIFDVSDKKAPKRIATFSHGGGAGHVEVKGQYAFVGGPPGLQIVDISDPRHPKLFAASDKGRAGVVVGDYIYTPAYFGKDNLFVTDIADLKNPRLVDSFDPGDYSYATQCAVHGEYLYLASLPYVSICKAPMSSEAPKGIVAVECATTATRESLRASLMDSELGAEIAEALPSRSEPGRADADAIHSLLRRIAPATDEKSAALSAALAETVYRLLGLVVHLDVESELVPGFSEAAATVLTNRGTEEIAVAKPTLLSPDRRVRVEPVEEWKDRTLKPGAAAAANFRIHLAAEVEPDERIPLTAAWTYSWKGASTTVARTWCLRAAQALTVFERIPRLDVTNLDPCSFCFSVRNNTSEPQDVRTHIDLPKGWLATPGPDQAAAIGPKETKEFATFLKLPDAETALGPSPCSLTVSLGGKIAYSKALDAVGTRLMRWRTIGPFAFDVTSKKRPIPETEVDFEKTYNGGQIAWKLYVCGEGAPIDLAIPGTTGPGSGSVLLFYGATYIHSDRELDVKLVASGPPEILSGPRELKGWLNGRQALGARIQLPPTPGEQFSTVEQPGGERAAPADDEADEKQAPAHLRKGWNLLLIRACWISNWRFEGYWAASEPKWLFRLAVQELDGKPIPNLTFDSERGNPARKEQAGR